MREITTERLVLAPLTPGDFDDILALWQDPAFHGPLTGRPLTAEEVWMRLLRDIGHWSVLGHGNWAMRLRETGAFVGTMGVLDYRRDIAPGLDAPELGWGIGGAFQGQGLASEALVAALDWAERTLGAKRTVCIISPDNGPSLRLAERAGFVVIDQRPFKGAPIAVLERIAPA